MNMGCSQGPGGGSSPGGGFGGMVSVAPGAAGSVWEQSGHTPGWVIIFPLCKLS